VPAKPTNPVDTTGAGDAFLGALALCLAHGEPLPKAVEYAVAVGTLATEHRGAQLPADALRRLSGDGG
jgi:ribokinase